MKIPFASHIGTKIMALVLAVFIWGFAYMENLQEANVAYEIEISTPPDVEMENPGPRTRYLVVKGPRRLVERLDEARNNRIVKTIRKEDLEKFKETDEFPYTVTVLRSDLRAPEPLTFPELPMEIEISLSRVKEKRLPVKLRVSGTPAPGYVYSEESSTVMPSQVTATGPQSLLDQAEFIHTEELEITGLTAPRRETYAQLVNTINGERISLSRPYVSAWIDIRQDLKSRTFEEVPVKVLWPPGGFPYKLEAKPAAVAVTVKGPQQRLENISADDIVVYVEVNSEHTPRDTGYVVSTKVDAPDDVTATVEQDTLSLVVSRRAAPEG